MESVIYFPETGSFICASEKKPITFYEVKFNQTKLFGQEVLSHLKIKLLVNDVSGVTCFNNKKVILSDDSNLVLFLDENDKVSGQVSLEAGLNGLTEDVYQAEGICFNGDDLIIASEPDMIYFFKKK